MTEPTIKVVGVYRLNVTDELVREQPSILHGENSRVASRATLEQQIREQLNSVVLVEALVLHRDERFDMSDFITLLAPGGLPPAKESLMALLLLRVVGLPQCPLVTCALRSSCTSGTRPHLCSQATVRLSVHSPSKCHASFRSNVGLSASRHIKCARSEATDPIACALLQSESSKT
jgi:hypothetical protein